MQKFYNNIKKLINTSYSVSDSYSSIYYQHASIGIKTMHGKLDPRFWRKVKVIINFTSYDVYLSFFVVLTFFSLSGRYNFTHISIVVLPHTKYPNYF